MKALYTFHFMFPVILRPFRKSVKYGTDDDNSNDIQAILVNGVMKAVGSGKICKTKVEEIWQHYKNIF